MTSNTADIAQAHKALVQAAEALRRCILHDHSQSSYAQSAFEAAINAERKIATWMEADEEQRVAGPLASKAWTAWEKANHPEVTRWAQSKVFFDGFMDGWRAKRSPPGGHGASKADHIKHMVDRFLGWRLPENFSPDAGISFKAAFNEHTAWPSKHQPMGTNLFDATQAEAMVRHMVEGLVE